MLTIPVGRVFASPGETQHVDWAHEVCMHACVLAELTLPGTVQPAGTAPALASARMPAPPRPMERFAVTQSTRRRRHETHPRDVAGCRRKLDETLRSEIKTRKPTTRLVTRCSALANV